MGDHNSKIAEKWMSTGHAQLRRLALADRALRDRW
jgi:hypothetical protein